MSLFGDIGEEQMADMENRVRLGVQVLDLVYPTWLESVDLPTLNLGSTESCVLGQLYGDYFEGRDALSSQLNEYWGDVPEKLQDEILAVDPLFLSPDGEVQGCLYELGFEQADYGPCSDLIGSVQYETLTELWAEAVKRRRLG